MTEEKNDSLSQEENPEVKEEKVNTAEKTEGASNTGEKTEVKDGADIKPKEEKEIPIPSGQEPESAEKDDKKSKAKKKPRGKKKKAALKAVPSGRAYIQATYNNTIVTITDQTGNVIAWSSAGINGFKGPKKATPYAAGVIVRDVIGRCKERGLNEVHVFVKGVGTGREAAIRALNANGINILGIKDMTPIPHNGCRPKKPRRV